MFDKLRNRHLVKEVEIKENRDEILKYLEVEHPELKNMDEDKMHAFLTQYFHQRELKKRKKLQEHLEVFNDVVLAIIITIIVLNLPLPRDHSYATMHHLVKTIGIYLISFVVIANFWLTHHFIFAKIRGGINEKLVVLDFVFMVELSLLPFLTKWMEVDQTSLPIMVYGVVYLMATVTLMLTSMMSYRTMKHQYPNIYKQLQKIERGRLFTFVPLNIILIIASYWFPKVIFVLYVAMPILSFFSYIFADEDERRFERYFEENRQHNTIAEAKAGHLVHAVADQISDQVSDQISDQISEQVAEQINDVMANINDDEKHSEKN